MSTDSLTITPDSLTADSLPLKPPTIVPDTLPLYWQQTFISGTRYQTQPEQPESGVVGIPVAYNPRTDDTMALLLLVCFFLSAAALAYSKKFLLRQLKEFVLHRERSSIFDITTAVDVRYLLVLAAQTCMLAGVVFFDYFHHTQPALAATLPPLLLLGIYASACLCYLLLKWVLYRFLGWIFFDKTRTDLWLESYATVIYYAGFLLFPFVLLIIYFDLSLTQMAVSALILLIFAKIAVFYKWIQLFSHQSGALLALILYFCALEIVPCLLLYQGLIQINKLLLIKI